MRKLVLSLILFLSHVDIIRFVSLYNISNSLLRLNSCHLMIVFDLPYKKLLPNNYVIFIRLFARYDAILISLW